MLGRVLGLQFGVKDLLDLFDYSSPSHLALSLPGYFSIDGGKTPLNHFSTSGDFGDWSGILGVDANNAIATRGQVNPFTATDLTEMDVLTASTLTGGCLGCPWPVTLRFQH